MEALSTLVTEMSKSCYFPVKLEKRLDEKNEKKRKKYPFRQEKAQDSTECCKCHTQLSNYAVFATGFSCYGSI